MKTCFCFILSLVLFSACTTKEGKQLIQKILPLEEKETALPLTPIDSLKRTRLYTYSNAPIVKDQNVIYSGGVSLAWKELKKIIGQESVLLLNGPKWLPELNKDPLTRKDIDDKSLSVFVGPGETVADSLEEAFHVSIPDSIRAHALLISLKLFKKLDFPDEINSSKETGGLSDFLFAGKKVEHNYVWAEDTKDASRYKLYDYKNDDHFILQIPVDNDSSEVFLAKITPKKTLKESYQYVQEKLSKKSRFEFTGEDKIAFPSVYFNIYKSHHELVKPIAGTDLHISYFEQYLKFALNNKGVILSDSVAVAVDSVAADPVVPKILYFNKPFLIILKEKNRKTPYFLMWVGNTELMKEDAL